MQDSATTGPIGKAGADDADARSHKRLGWDNLSYTTRVTVAFAFIAAMTALVAIGVVSFVWEQHFQTYTRENIERTAQQVAQDIAQNYETVLVHRRRRNARARPIHGQRHAEHRHARRRQPRAREQRGVHRVRLHAYRKRGGRRGRRFAHPEAREARADGSRCPIVIDQGQPSEQAVGSVSVWVLGSDTLLRSTDEEFRDKSYQAMFFAAAMAISWHRASASCSHATW
ncbi:MAG: hypothetical protein V8S24_00105 [Gordonibacter pamelaeae]